MPPELQLSHAVRPNDFQKTQPQVLRGAQVSAPNERGLVPQSHAPDRATHTVYYLVQTQPPCHYHPARQPKSPRQQLVPTAEMKTIAQQMALWLPIPPAYGAPTAHEH